MSLHLRGAVLPHGDVRDVFVKAGRVTFTPQADARTVFEGGYLLPGLVDAHAHLGLHSPAANGATAAERVRASAAAQLRAGVLVVREPGGPDRESARVGPEDGLPRIYSAGRFLAPPGGYFPGLAREVGPDELPVAAVEEAAAGAGWAKVIGDFFGDRGRLAANYRAEALTEAAGEVHRAGGRITIHAVLPQVIAAAVEAGFDAIEHGTLIREEHLAPMAERGTALIPTMLIRDGILGVLRDASAPRAEIEEMRRALARQPMLVRLAAEAGVTVLAGTDAGMGPHGEIAAEVEHLVDAGFEPEAALGAASWAARAYLGLPGIEEGAPADLVGYREDPRAGLMELRRPAALVLDGRVVTPHA